MVNDLYTHIECARGWRAGRAKERESERDTLRGRSDGVKGWRTDRKSSAYTARAHTLLHYVCVAATTAHDDWQVESSGGR